MDAEYLAFHLATHGFNAKTKGGYVVVGLGGSICKLNRHGSAPGLRSITV